MIKIIVNLLHRIKVIDSCPNCDSAWTGGHPNPEELTTCIVCGKRKTAEISGWVWGKLVDPFCIVGRYITKRNFNTIKEKARRALRVG